MCSALWVWSEAGGWLGGEGARARCGRISWFGGAIIVGFEVDFSVNGGNGQAMCLGTATGLGLLKGGMNISSGGDGMRRRFVGGVGITEEGE